MKLVRLGLLRFFGRQARPATALGMLGLGLFTLLCPKVLTARELWPGMIIFGHCLLLAILLGRFESPGFAFTYSRGFSRNTLWGHMMLTSALSALKAWLIASLMIWTGLRSYIHDLLQSPHFPFMAPRETLTPLVWLGLYVLLAPACHYVWIRLAQPTKGRQGGSAVVVGLLASLLVSFVMVRHLNGYFAWLAGALYVVVVACLVVGGRALHSSLEVRA